MTVPGGLTAMMMAAASGGGSSTPYFDAVSADSPLAYYRHKEVSGTTIVNSGSIGSAINGTTSGGPTLAQSSLIQDVGDTSILFDGTNDYYLTPTNSTLGTVTGTPNRVVEFWFSTTTTATTKVPVSLRPAVAGISSNTYLLVLLNQSSGNGQVSVISGANTIFSVATGLNDGNPHHVVAVKTGTAIDIYIDGAFDVSGSGGALSGTDPLRLSVGVNNGGSPIAGQYFPGHVDEVAVYETLSAARITAHYNSGI